MKFITLSDTHFEFGKTNFLPIVLEGEDTLDTTLILAGDINVGFGNIRKTLVHYAEAFAHVVYVPGNHDYYVGSIRGLDSQLNQLAAEVENIHYLQCSTVTIDGVVIGGTTMWGYCDATIANLLNDFALIKDFNPYDMNKLHEEQKAWITDNVKDVDIMVTHFCPSPTLGNPNFDSTTKLNKYFCPDVISELDSMPTVWVFGHTHYSRDEKSLETHFISTQVGYPGEFLSVDLKEYSIEPKRISRNYCIQDAGL